MKTLDLRNLFATYDKVNNGTRNEVYYSSHTNNYIVFTPYDDCTTKSICNAIDDEPYNYLMHVLNTSNNVIVHWSQVQGTTSDYTIYLNAAQDVEKPTHKKIVDYLKHMVTQGNSMKYNFVKDGLMTPIRREEMRKIGGKQ
jgi:hypothetical protein